VKGLLIRLRVTFELASNDEERAGILAAIEARRDDLELVIEAESSLNEKGAPRIENTERKIGALDDARDRMLSRPA